jgi:hypothetical protein
VTGPLIDQETHEECVPREQAEGWHDAGRSVWDAWRALSGARTIVEQADAVSALSNAMSDLATFLPGYDYETGDFPDDGED